MRCDRISLFVAALVVVTAGAASAASVTVRTSPADGLFANGRAYCAAVNGGTTQVLVTTVLFGQEAGSALATNGFTIPPEETRFGTRVATNNDSPSNFNPSWCECVVPDKAKVRCSFIYVNGNEVMVVPAK